MKGRVWTLTQTEDTLWYHVYENQQKRREGSDRKRKTSVSLRVENKPNKKIKREVKEEDEPQGVPLEQAYGEEEEILRDYFQLDVNLGDLYNKWGDADPHFRSIAKVFTGLCVRLPFYDTGICIEGVKSDICASSVPRCANAATGPHRMPLFIHLHF